jgi:hypothetical protein
LEEEIKFKPKPNTMKSIIFSSIAILFIGITAISQTVLAPFNPNKEAKKWGFINEKGEVVIAATYDEVLEFSSEGFTLFRKGDTWSVISNSNEDVAVEAKGFTPVGIFGFGKRSFSNGFVIVTQSKLIGAIDSKGKTIHEFKYNGITDFENGFATAKIGKNFFILKADGTSTSVPNVIDLDSFKEGLAPYRAANKMFGFIDANGKEVIAATFQGVGYFSNGLAWAKNTDGTVGYIDKTGKMAIDAKFLAAKEFDNVVGVARVKLGEEWMYVRKNGETFKVNGASTLGDFSDGLAYVKMGEKVGFVNDKGEWVIEAKYDKVRDFQFGYAAVLVGEKWGVINKKGEFVCEPKFDDIKNFSKVK